MVSCGINKQVLQRAGQQDLGRLDALKTWCACMALTSQGHRSSGYGVRADTHLLISINPLRLVLIHAWVIHRLSTDYPQIIRTDYPLTDYPHAHGHIRRSVLRPLHAARMPLAVPNTFKSLLLRS